MHEGFRRKIEAPVPEGYKKIESLYKELSALGFKHAEEVEDFITDAAEDLQLEEHFKKSNTDKRVTEWQVSDVLYAVIQLAIEAEKAQRVAKEAPDHTLTIDESNEKAALIKELSKTLLRTAMLHKNEPWFANGYTTSGSPYYILHRMYTDVTELVAKTTAPEEQILILRGGIEQIKAAVDQYRKDYAGKQTQ